MLNTFFNRVDYEIMWKNTVQPGRLKIKMVQRKCDLHAR